MKKLKNLKKPTKILLLTNWLVLISAAMIAPIYAIYVEQIWGDLMDASIALGLFALTAWIFTLLSWNFTDKIKNKTLLIVLWYILIWIWFFLYTIVDSIMFLFAVQILIWIWEAIYSPPFDALYWESLKKNQRWFGWGVWEFTNYFTIAIWAFTWWLMVTYFWFNSIFISMWILCFVSALYLYLVSIWFKCKLK